MTGPRQLQLRGIGAPGAPGHPVLSPVAQEAGPENVTTRPQLMEDRSVRDLALRLKSANPNQTHVHFQVRFYKSKVNLISLISPSNNQITFPSKKISAN